MVVRKFFIAFFCLFVCEEVKMLSFRLCIFFILDVWKQIFIQSPIICSSLLIKCLVGKRTPDCTCQTVLKIPELARSTAEQLAELVVYKK